ncbi:MAG: hypothetical protein DRJ69_04910 [Thermoprotei archaeon]|nr:MAG: hypothetical protein DRJ69_04910 [Thermoprotei archaeon]
MLVGHVAYAGSSSWLHMDLTAGPGNKASHLAQLAGSCIGLEVEPRRALDIKKLARRLRILVDVVASDSKSPPLRLREPSSLIVDPPCSNLGRLSYDPEVKLWITRRRIEELTRLQRGLLRTAVEEAPRGSLITYSACTFTKLECEGVVEEALKAGAQPVQQEPFIGLPAPPRGLAQRMLPHVHDTAGFYIAKLVKE